MLNLPAAPNLQPALAPAAPSTRELAVELAVVIPTFNEISNVEELLSRLGRVLGGVGWEAIFVDDDSSDGTAARLHRLALTDARVRCLRRIGRRGLSSACVEGMLATGAPYIAVMDADLQHDETILPQMLNSLKSGGADLVVGSRYVAGGGVGSWDGGRQKISSAATAMAQRVLGLTLTDPMSGFFMLRREVLDGAVYRLSSIGFKILVDLVVSSPQKPRIQELPYQFRNRLAGQSKLDNRVAWDFLMLLADKTIGRWMPVRLVSFGLIGSFGVLVHLAVLRTVLAANGNDFQPAQTTAVAVAMVGNFFLNNALTYRDQQLRGWAVLPGLLKFMAACAVGAFANVGVATYIHGGYGGNWLLSALAGILVGTVWNYGATAWLVWVNKPKQKT